MAATKEEMQDKIAKAAVKIQARWRGYITRQYLIYKKKSELEKALIVSKEQELKKYMEDLYALKKLHQRTRTKQIQLSVAAGIPADPYQNSSKILTMVGKP